MKNVMAMGLAVTLLLGANAVKAEDTLQGTWRLISGEANGKALTQKQLQAGKLVIKGDHYSVTLDESGAVTGVQKLDPKQKIKTIDITNATGPHKDQTCLGIYEVKGNEFRVAFAPTGKARPSSFSTKADSGIWMHTWKRVKE